MPINGGEQDHCKEEYTMNEPIVGLQIDKKVENTNETPASARQGWFLIGFVTVTALALATLVLYSMQANSQFQTKTRTDLAAITEQIGRIQDQHRASESRISNLLQELADTRQALGESKQELGKAVRQVKLDTQKTRNDLGQVIAAKADSTEVQAVKHEAATKIEQVSTDVGGVKNEVGTVKTDLASTKVELEGTNRRLLDVSETLSAAIAKNAAELAQLRRKGERNYYEFELGAKNTWTGVEDIKLALTKTDIKNRKFNIRIMVDDNQLEKKDRTINEPLQFLVGRNRVRYELVINWVKKDKVGGYLSTPIDKALSAELKLPTR
jgi:septal ring factor EnvC (AmiA/AmiB activator)